MATHLQEGASHGSNWRFAHLTSASCAVRNGLNLHKLLVNPECATGQEPAPEDSKHTPAREPCVCGVGEEAQALQNHAPALASPIGDRRTVASLVFSRELVVPNGGEHLQPATTALHLELLFQAMGRACYSTRDSSTMHLRDLVHPPGRWPIF